MTKDLGSSKCLQDPSLGSVLQLFALSGSQSQAALVTLSSEVKARYFFIGHVISLSKYLLDSTDGAIFSKK